MPGTPVSTMAKYLGVSDKTVKKYIKPLIAQFEETKRTIIMRLSILGWTQQEISDKLAAMYPNADGVSQKAVSNFLVESGTFQDLLKNENTKGIEPDKLARRHELPEVLVWATILEGMDDKERMARLVGAPFHVNSPH